MLTVTGNGILLKDMTALMKSYTECVYFFGDNNNKAIIYPGFPSGRKYSAYESFSFSQKEMLNKRFVSSLQIKKLKLIKVKFPEEFF